MIIVGIDPGITGAVAFWKNGTLGYVYDMPVDAGRVNGRELCDWLDGHADVVYLEWTQPMPKNGSIASYSLGLNSGIVIGVVQALGISLERVRPSTWKLAMGLRNKPKAASRGHGHRAVAGLRPPVPPGEGRRPCRGGVDRPLRGLREHQTCHDRGRRQ